MGVDEFDVTPICRAFLKPALYLGVPVAWFWGEMVLATMLVSFSPIVTLPLMCLVAGHVLTMGLVRWDPHAVSLVIAALSCCRSPNQLFGYSEVIWYVI